MNYTRNLLLVVITAFSFAIPSIAELGKTLWIRDSAKPGTWKPQDGVCLYQDYMLNGCGAITEVRAGSLGIVLTEQSKPILPGKSIRIVKDTRRPVTTESVSAKMPASNAKNINLALGITAGTNYFYPNAHIQLALGRNWSIGVMPMFASYETDATSDVTAYGAYLTLTYYYTHFAFKGVQFEGGIGLNSSHIQQAATTTLGAVDDKQTSPAVKFTIGWAGRALWDLGLDIGVAAGVQYIGFDDTYVKDYHLSGIVPLMSAYLAYGF